MICDNCKIEYEGRSNSKFCSTKCKNDWHNKKKSNLSDAFTLAMPARNSAIMDNNRAVGQISTSVVNSISGGFGGTLQDGIKNITRINNNPYYTLAMLGGAVIGCFVGYKMSDKKSNFSNMLMGAGVGLLGGQLFYTLHHQFQLLDMERQQDINATTNTLQDSPRAARIITSQEAMYMNIPTITFDGAWGAFLGNRINYNFTALVYGIPGGGKSYFATAYARYIEKMGKVLYVLAEESLSPHVQARINRYKTANTDYIVTRNEDIVIKTVKEGNYKFLIVDSINGMMNYNNHLQFLLKIKNLNLYGSMILNQVNKNGQFTGKQEVLHEVDLEIVVEDGIATVAKNRFGISGKSMRIFNDTNSEIIKNLKYEKDSIGVN